MFDLTTIRSAFIVMTAATLTAGGRRASENEGDGVTMTFVRIPAGEFAGGPPAAQSGKRDSEGLQHQPKTIESFYMSVTEVTQQQYAQVMGYNPSRFNGADNPVETVSWAGATAFCRRLSKKTGRKITLPTEAQWEYACRAGTATRFSFGEDAHLLESHAWYKANSGRRSHPVAMKKPNTWGLYDMHGNVQEWCSDQFHDPYYSRSLNLDPEGPSILRVVRGGAHAHAGDSCRSASRRGSSSDNRTGVTGFRAVFAGTAEKGRKTMHITLATEARKMVIAPEKGREARGQGWRMISGKVRDETGIPVDSAEMAILPMRHWILSRYDGVSFEADWRPRSSTTLMQDQYHFIARHAKRNLAAVVEINRDTDTLDVVLRPGAIIIGKVVDSSGNGIEKARVTMKIKGSDWLELYPWFFASTDAAGRFNIRGVPLEHGYVLTARVRERGMAHVEINSDDVRDNRIDLGSILLARGELSVSGVVVDANGMPVTDVTVHFSGKEQIGTRSRTDANGRFKADGIFPGRVRVTADHEGSDGLWRSGYADTEAGATNVKVVLDNKGVAPPKGRACFPSDSGVWVDDAVVPISEVARGQVVGQIARAVPGAPFAHVERIEEHVGAFECRDVLLGSGNRISVVDSHCFMLDCGRWMAAQDLRAGLRLRTIDGTVAIKSVTTRPTPYTGKVYNLKISNSDRYAVGKDGVIVRDY